MLRANCSRRISSSGTTGALLVAAGATAAGLPPAAVFPASFFPAQQLPASPASARPARRPAAAPTTTSLERSSGIVSRADWARRRPTPRSADSSFPSFSSPSQFVAVFPRLWRVPIAARHARLRRVQAEKCRLCHAVRPLLLRRLPDDDGRRSAHNGGVVFDDNDNQVARVVLGAVHFLPDDIEPRRRCGRRRRWPGRRSARVVAALRELHGAQRVHVACRGRARRV